MYYHRLEVKNEDWKRLQTASVESMQMLAFGAHMVFAEMVSRLTK